MMINDTRNHFDESHHSHKFTVYYVMNEYGVHNKNMARYEHIQGYYRPWKTWKPWKCPGIGFFPGKTLENYQNALE